MQEGISTLSGHFCTCSTHTNFVAVKTRVNVTFTHYVFRVKRIEHFILSHQRWPVACTWTPGQSNTLSVHSFTLAVACCLCLDLFKCLLIQYSLVPTFSNLRLGEPGNEARYRIHSWSINTLYVPQLHCRASFRGGAFALPCQSLTPPWKLGWPFFPRGNWM